MTTSNLFTQSASSTFTVTSTSAVFTLPAFDSGNMMVALTNNGPNVVFYAWANNAVGSTTFLQPGENRLISGAGNMIAIALLGSPHGSTVQLQRGSVSTMTQF